jgi:ABC-2 type transport system ATP-binding protein
VSSTPHESEPARPPTPAVEAVALTRRFGAKEVVCDLSLTVAPGEFLGFLGRNGAGKSTTIRMLTGLLPATSGSARILGLPVGVDRVEFKRLIGVLPEDNALFDRLSLGEHLVLAGRLHGLSATDAARRRDDLLDLLELGNDRHVHAVEASQGMRKKAALGMALIHAPRVLFLDEPFNGLDPLAARTVRLLLERLVAGGLTAFITSHVLEVVERLCTRIAVIHEGRLIADVSRDELRTCGVSLEERFSALVGHEHDLPELPWLVPIREPGLAAADPGGRPSRVPPKLT